MNCYYCDLIKANDPSYEPTPAAHDPGSAAPRCPKHWRYVCERCGNPAHFMSVSYCPEQGRLFCSECAGESEEVVGPFWGREYYFRYRSPWSGDWVPALDRLEYEGRHPLQNPETEQAAGQAISEEAYLVRYPVKPLQWRSDGELTDADVQATWDANAERWTATYDDDGDSNRRFQSDEPMLALLGDVDGLRVLDVGSGNGYLCRKLASAGATMTGVEMSAEFVRMAKQREAEEGLGITYHRGTVANMAYLESSHFDRAVSNYVLMDVQHYTDALAEVFRILRPGGWFVSVISHPCFSCGPAGWVAPAPDSPRTEDRYAWQVDEYFRRGPFLGKWRDLDPVLSFHRPLRDYWQAFAEAGFIVDGFEEPSVTERGRRELPASRVARSLRTPYSCIFRLVKPIGAT